MPHHRALFSLRPFRHRRSRRRLAMSSAAKEQEALSLAVRLHRSPNMVRSIRSSPLPGGMSLVIRVAAGCPISAAAASEHTGLDVPTITKMAALYLMVALFDRQGDPHRTLGVTPDMPIEKAREHRKWLLKWLHPDRNANRDIAVLTTRVLDAWNEVLALPAAPTAEAQNATADAPPSPKRQRRIARHFWIPMPL